MGDDRGGAGHGPAGRLADATLEVGWSRWRRELFVRDGDRDIGSIVRADERFTLEVEGTEWWVRLDGLGMIRGVVTDSERTPLLLFAGQIDWGGALTRKGRTLTVDIGTRWRNFRPAPGSVTDQGDRVVLQVLPFRRAGSTGWAVRTAQTAPGDVAATLALWGALVLARARAPWLKITTAWLPPSRIERELESLRSRMD